MATVNLAALDRNKVVADYCIDIFKELKSLEGILLVANRKAQRIINKAERRGWERRRRQMTYQS